MCDENDYCQKRRALQATVVVWLVIFAIALMVALTDWLVPKILGSTMLILIATAITRIAIRTFRNGFK
jgi:hypothetical protein